MLGDLLLENDQRVERVKPRECDSRALSCLSQAVLVLRWFRERTDPARLGPDHGVSRATDRKSVV